MGLSFFIITFEPKGGNMTKIITQENFNDLYIDPIEQERIDKFVCDEMARQIHRYIKAMHGSKAMMLKFEDNLSALTVEQKEEAIAYYIDFNRKVLSGLDLKVVLARAMANYCDTFSFLQELLSNKEKFDFYLKRIKSKYVQYHEIYEENGKFGMKDHKGNILIQPLYDFLRTPYIFSEDLSIIPVIAQKDGKMGLILPDGHNTIVADFIYDDISLREEAPFFEAVKGEETFLLKGE